MSEAREDPTAFDVSAYLRGRVVMIRLAIRQDDAPGAPPEGCPSEQVGIRLGCNEVAAIEEEFGGVSAFDQSVGDKPMDALRRALAIATGAEPGDAEAFREMGRRLLDSEFPVYLGALEAAWLLAHGSGEEDAGKALTGRRALTLDGTRQVADLFQTMIDEIASRGTNGSRSGQPRRSRARSTSSGG